jgi:hypothetical protein
MQAQGELTSPARMRVECERGRERLTLRNGSQVRKGDRLSLSVEVDEPLFATLVALSPDGVLSPLYPEHGSVPLAPRQRTRLPKSRAQFLEPDAETGEERLILFFTTAPLSQGLQPAHDWLERLRARGEWPDNWPLPARKALPQSAASTATTRQDARLVTRGIVVQRARAEPLDEPVLVSLELLSFAHGPSL